MSSDISAESPAITSEAHPFQVNARSHNGVHDQLSLTCTQRYKPLPAIGSTHDICSCLQRDHTKHDPLVQSGIAATLPSASAHWMIVMLALTSEWDIIIISHSLIIYHSLPTVTVCVRLPDSGRSLVTLPTSSPLSCLVTAALKDAGTVNVDKRTKGGADGWTLCTSEVPKRELSDLSLSLHDAGLSSSCTLHLVPPSSDPSSSDNTGHPHSQSRQNIVHPLLDPAPNLLTSCRSPPFLDVQLFVTVNFYSIICERISKSSACYD